MQVDGAVAALPWLGCKVRGSLALSCGPSQEPNPTAAPQRQQRQHLDSCSRSRGLASPWRVSVGSRWIENSVCLAEGERGVVMQLPQHSRCLPPRQQPYQPRSPGPAFAEGYVPALSIPYRAEATRFGHRFRHACRGLHAFTLEHLRHASHARVPMRPRHPAAARQSSSARPQRSKAHRGARSRGLQPSRPSSVEVCACMETQRARGLTAPSVRTCLPWGSTRSAWLLHSRTRGAAEPESRQTSGALPASAECRFIWACGWGRAVPGFG